ncbi:siroheme synthase CysG [Aeromonas hydrophila]|uniref:Siroheme synthase 3 n=1 Tax=Aeromonas hydrophila subsp. hydrophila (strain ATCC 7966 / DSM 30187 / BCRC 13018 / CCUG 14551 / JCM 1027 / KCTC 2358 / NCIMB 9240 / NCTC 8049) TaxID=380703 RepID=CYSG3_AERHH|nr:siroheme synthase CysG [Aeromonas hydrophila]A0KQJ4.1 RecName: Full=Siroheme synthase 3; Includes: RecName: Full=Uroporphyrinogen-III C-methyltransferase 3; Short=Urogen III methylase 3; AltName: Full=SUMT 3; AltName: Full=Uroporphyrinogen III methylase 3; Short=UROM 3; Includes: RecName: Full=Precorrin-2 dehydrogenase 3; Includes: RecName: Full=Sirohydrochlorin ferrochelatase 3 [Aeromonas hydrophila subsp. hydrophila ATCC 7966]ABK37547.1 siroheme synthase [Aeromonas hydrophila subsp. hydrophi
MDYLPIFCRLDNKPVLLVGGGEVAERKARLLLDAGAQLTVVAPELDPELAELAANGSIEWLAGEFAPQQLTGKWLVVAATDRREVNALVYQSANQARIFANVVDDPKRSSFIMPSIIDRSPLMVAISSGGKAPVLARLLREKLEALLPQHLGAVAAFAGSLRERVKARFASMGERRRFWERLLGADRLGQALARGDSASANQLADSLFADESQSGGEVVLVGAGPGDPGLLTLHALRQMQQADVVVYDRLVSDEVMALVRRDARRIFVGKQAGNHCVPQEGINQLLLDEAKKGQRVVRLKGGDPFIFGRGGEELETLVGSGIGFQVVPGITAASGCAAYAGIPLTHRDHAQSVRFVTAHGKGGAQDLDWPLLAKDKQTLVFYMGLSSCTTIREQLLTHGKAGDTPVALIERGTQPSQRVIRGTLAQLPELALGVESPALIMVGSVVTLADQLAWFGQGGAADAALASA